MTRAASLILATFLATIPALASAEKLPDIPADGRMKIFTYEESDVYKIVTKYGFQTSIVFDPSEVIQTISVGDRSMWQIVPTANRMFIRPAGDNFFTNMTVLTNKRSYQFDLQSVGPDDTTSKIIYVAKFIYPGKRTAPSMMEDPFTGYTPAQLGAPIVPAGPSRASTPPAAKPMSSHAPEKIVPMQPETVPPPVLTSQPASPPLARKNYDYTFTGPDGLAPLQAFDDGKSTYLRYRDTSRLPDAYVIDAMGREKPVPHYVFEDMMVIERVVGELALKSEGGIVHIYNEKLNPESM